jgi:hypothetical protein
MPTAGAELAGVIDDRVEHAPAQAVGRSPATGLGGKQRDARRPAALGR